MNDLDDIYDEKKVKWPNNFKSNKGMDAYKIQGGIYYGN